MKRRFGAENLHDFDELLAYGVRGPAPDAGISRFGLATLPVAVIGIIHGCRLQDAGGDRLAILPVAMVVDFKIPVALPVAIDPHSNGPMTWRLKHTFC